MAVEDREYQKRAVDLCRDEFVKGNRRVVLYIPTGGGKSTVACMIIELSVARGTRVLVLAHRRKLIQQLAERLQLFNIPYTIEMANLPNAAWVKKDRNARVIIASRDTLLSRAVHNDWIGLPTDIGLCVLDECHNAEAKSYADLVTRCGAKFLLGLTATPCLADGSGLGRRNWDVIVEGATIPELIEGKFLVPIKYYAPPGMGEKRAKGGKTTVAGDPVDHWKRYAEGMRTIAFTQTVAEAIGVRDRFIKAGIPAEVVSAKSTDAEREAVIERVKSGKTLWVGNAALWTEGVDIPELTCCQLLSKCGSFIRYAQAIGRIMRPAPWIGKEYGILLDHSAATFEHGFPHEAVQWELAEDDNLDTRLKKQREAGERANPVCCRSCGCLFAGSPVCPECGSPIPRAERTEKAETAKERLVQVGDAMTPSDMDRMQRQWTTILRQCAYQGRTCKVASARFKQMYGAYPDRAGVFPTVSFRDADTPVSVKCPNLIRQKV